MTRFGPYGYGVGQLDESQQILMRNCGDEVRELLHDGYPVTSGTATNAAALSRLIDTAYSDIKARVENGYLTETPREGDGDVNRRICAYRSWADSGQTGSQSCTLVVRRAKGERKANT